MTDSASPLFVVVLTDDQLLPSPRAVGPFENFDVAQTFRQTLLDRWNMTGEPVPEATVVRVEPDFPGVVVGEL